MTTKKDKALYVRWMLESIGKIQAYASGMTCEQFARDGKSHDACLMQFQHLGETAGKMKAAFPKDASLPYRQMVGFRNYIAHDYVGIELAEVYDTIAHDLPALKEKLERMAE